jgi:hypothetical protein
MNNVKTSPKGIDKQIQKLQEYLYSKLKTKWGITDDDWQSYGRAYRNQKEKGYIPEVYTGSDEYEEVFADDSLKVLSFFGVGDSFKGSYSLTGPVFLIFFVNIEELKTLTHRGDEEVRLDVQLICKDADFGFTMTGVQTGIDNVYKEYPGIRRDEGMLSKDMHPYHCFRIDFELTYEPQNCS